LSSAGPLDWVLVFLFAVSAVAVVYLYFGYPLLLLVLARLRPRPVAAGLVRPAVTVVVPAHDEEAVIGEKVDDCLAQDYPADRLEVLVVSDGSTDRTERIVRERATRDPRVRLLSIPRSGKAAALDRGALAATGEILVLTDANALLAPGSLARLVEPFADPEVGGVCGRKRYRRGRGADATELGENLYWRWDQWQKGLESRIGSVFAADGALYAVRRGLYVPMADPAQADDIAISARVVLQGRRLLFEPEAAAFEEAPAEGRDELRRKIRVTNHSVRALLNLGRRLWTSGFYSVELLSHKLLRHLAPFPLLALLVSSLALAIRLDGAAGAFFGLCLALQAALYGLGLLGFLLRGTRAGRLRFLSIPYYFSMVNLAALLGVLSILRGVRTVRWTPRQGGETTTGGREP
jgi:cellulose synthase/poly-beta-1,6-N-acetylglucosamine synthase-like glycosyltransferase